MQQDIYEKLQIWRDEDHADSIILSRHEIIQILEQYYDLEKFIQIQYRGH